MTTDHPTLVKALCKSGTDIFIDLDPFKSHLLHVVPCISSEAGELWDAIKRYVIYNQPMDRANVVEELGDIEFYLEAIRQALNLTREETLLNNIEKLRIRYSKMTYSDQAAQERKDKV